MELNYLLTVINELVISRYGITLLINARRTLNMYMVHESVILSSTSPKSRTCHALSNTRTKAGPWQWVALHLSMQLLLIQQPVVQYMCTDANSEKSPSVVSTCEFCLVVSGRQIPARVPRPVGVINETDMGLTLAARRLLSLSDWLCHSIVYAKSIMAVRRSAAWGIV